LRALFPSRRHPNRQRAGDFVVPPDTLPKLDFKDGIPSEQATLAVVPMMLSSLEVVRRRVKDPFLV
jgi:hypothetical protein